MLGASSCETLPPSRPYRASLIRIVNNVRILLVLLLALTALPLATRTHAQQLPAGLLVVVREDSTERPLPGVRVEVLGAEGATVTDSTGMARALAVPPGPRLVRVRASGYQMETFFVEFMPGETVEVEMDLYPAPYELDGITVTERMSSRTLRDAGFYQRQRSAFGTFITREDIDKRAPMRISDLLRNASGVTVVHCGSACRPSGYRIVSSRGNTGLGAQCAMQIYVDGRHVSDGDIDAWTVDSVEGIEVYNSTAGMPSEFNRPGAVCGAVAVWTRTGR